MKEQADLSRVDGVPSDRPLGSTASHNKLIGRPRWNKFGFWQWTCGCLQYQDGYDLCAFHKFYGYTALPRPVIRKDKKQ